MADLLPRMTPRIPLLLPPTCVRRSECHRAMFLVDSPDSEQYLLGREPCGVAAASSQTPHIREPIDCDVRLSEGFESGGGAMKGSWILGICLTVLLLSLTAHGATAGRNADGALIMHTNDAYTYSVGTKCTTPLARPATCEEAITRSGKAVRPVVWALMAFDSLASPAVTVVYFGLEMDEVCIDPAEISWSWCSPTGVVPSQVVSAEWPGDGESATVGWRVAVTQNLFPFLYMRIDEELCGEPGAYISTSINHVGGYAAFIDDSNPPVEDRIAQFGTVRWYEQGSNDCPVAQAEACCFEDASCMSLLAIDCETQGGTPYGAGSTCDPNPCMLPCCLPGGICELLDEISCAAHGGIADTTTIACDPNPCSQPSRGACCFGAFDCEILSEWDCAMLGGTWHGADSPCLPNPCLQEPRGACCSPTGNCYLTTRWTCLQLGFSWRGAHSSCVPNSCPTNWEKQPAPSARAPLTWGHLKAIFR